LCYVYCDLVSEEHFLVKAENALKSSACRIYSPKRDVSSLAKTYELFAWTAEATGDK